MGAAAPDEPVSLYRWSPALDYPAMGLNGWQFGLVLFLSVGVVGGEGLVPYYGGPPLELTLTSQEQAIWTFLNDHLKAAAQPELTLDPALTWAARAYSRWMIEQRRFEFSHDRLTEYLWQAGVIDHRYHAVLLKHPSVPGLATALLRSWLDEGFTQHGFTHLGLGVVSGPDQRFWLTATVTRRMVTVDAIPKVVGVGERVRLNGQLLGPVMKPRVLVTPPEGEVAYVPLEVVADRGFNGLLDKLDRRGVYRVEILGEGPLGPTIAALFPLAVGVSLPTMPPWSVAAYEPTYRSPEEAEAAMIELINQDRAQYRLPPLTASGELAVVAREHSQDMRAHEFFAHVSPTRGDLEARLSAAGLYPVNALENIAVNDSLLDAERKLMESPGHRQNLLSTQVNQAGVGIVFSSSTFTRVMYITQNFARFIERIPESQARVELLRVFNQQRALKGITPLEEDPGVSQVAQALVGVFFQRGGDATLRPNEIQEALAQMGIRPLLIGGVFYFTGALPELPNQPDLWRTEFTHIGVGVQSGLVLQQHRELYGVVLLPIQKR
ncbi:MAG: hypothetical protein HYZ73_02210 [Elusimicrobia bacterium]|nr:hypothetical protein [Elusimicrobiota bacterium]